MNIETLIRPFRAIGADIEVETIAADAGRRRGVNRAQNLAVTEGFALDVTERPNAERYRLIVREDLASRLNFVSLETLPKERHLVLLAQRASKDGAFVRAENRKFLCGHDERHWFVASLADVSVTRVREAMESLKPALVAAAQGRVHLRGKERNRRRNAVFMRQGEWFFLPRPDFAPPRNAVILRDEPIRRGAGKPHWIEALCRDGGEPVYVCTEYPNGLTETQYQRCLRREREASRYGWRIMRRNPSVFVRGKVRHADHATINLPCWHQVIMSAELLSRNVAFLD